MKYAMNMIKRFFIFCILLLQLQTMEAQFTRADLQATGLTCALCSNAINKALGILPFVASVKADIKNSSFSIVFKPGASVNPDEISKAVEDAGFFVGSLQLTGTFSGLEVKPGGLVKIGQYWFRFYKPGLNKLTGQTVKLMDKSFLTAKEFKKISAGAVPSLKTGRAERGMEKDGIKSGERIYHISN